MKMKMKGQTSLDFLMTYGWALLLIVIVVGALFALGVFNVGSFIGSRATGFAQVGVVAWNVDHGVNGVTVKLQNHAGADVNVTAFNMTYGTNTVDITYLPVNYNGGFLANGGTSGTITIGTVGGLSAGTTYMIPLSITYIDSNGFTYTESGTLSGTSS